MEYFIRHLLYLIDLICDGIKLKRYNSITNKPNVKFKGLFKLLIPYNDCQDTVN